MDQVILFLAFFLVVYVVYYFLTIFKKDKFDKKKLSPEINYLVSVYKIDVKKLTYKKFMKRMAVANAFIIAFVATIVVYIHGFVLQLLVAFLLGVPLIIFVYHFIGTYLQKKGMGKKHV